MTTFFGTLVSHSIIIQIAFPESFQENTGFHMTIPWNTVINKAELKFVLNNYIRFESYLIQYMQLQMHIYRIYIYLNLLKFHQSISLLNEAFQTLWKHFGREPLLRLSINCCIHIYIYINIYIYIYFSVAINLWESVKRYWNGWTVLIIYLR